MAARRLSSSLLLASSGNLASSATMSEAPLVWTSAEAYSQRYSYRVSSALGVQKRVMKPGMANSMKCSPVRPLR